MRITVQPTNVLPVGEYTLRLAAITPVEGKYGEQLRFRFEVAETGAHLGRAVYAYAPISGNPNSKCVRWASALLGRPLQPGEQLDLQSLVGKYARGVILTRQASGGREVSTLQELLPLKRPPKPTPSSGREDPFE